MHSDSTNSATVWRGVLVALLVLGAAAAIGVGAYNAGMAQGIAVSGHALAAPPPGAVPYAYYGWHRPWGVGFFPIFPFFSILFVFLILRGLWWRGPWYRGGWRGGYGPPPDRPSDEAHPRS
jgi:hypothetical protein